MDNLLLIILLVILCVALWWYWTYTKKPKVNPQVVNSQVASSEQESKSETSSMESKSVGSVEPILNQTDMAQLLKNINTNIDQMSSNQVLYPTAESEEQQNNMQIYYIYVPFANALVTKYGSKLNNLQVVNIQKQKQMPQNFGKPSVLPLNISNYLWYIASVSSNGSNPMSASSEENMNKCLSSVLMSVKPSMELTSAKTINFTSSEALGKFETGLATCISSSGMGMALINQLVPQINSDLKF